MNLKIMTFNLCYNEPKDGEHAWPHRIGGVRRIIKDNDPTVIGVQEALHGMLTDLDPLLPEYERYGFGRGDGREAGEFCAIYYKKDRLQPDKDNPLTASSDAGVYREIEPLRGYAFRDLDKGQFWLSETPDVPGSKSWDTCCERICTWVKLRDQETGSAFLMYNTHLDHLSEAARINGAALIYRTMSEHRAKWGLPAFLTDDMNCTPGGAPIRFWRGEMPVDGLRSDLQDAYNCAMQPVGRSFSGFRGDTNGEPIDYIFATPEVAFSSVTIDRTRYDGGYPSDHYPVVAEALFPR